MACNLQCAYCFEGKHEKIDFEKKNYIDFETFKKYFDTLIYYRCVLGSVDNRIDWHFHGGEFLLVPWSELRQMFDYIEERKKYFPNLTYCVQTNGIALTDEMAKYFAGHNKLVGFSFDGFDVTDRFSSECSKALIEKFRRFHSEYNMQSSYLVVLSKKNMKTWIDDFKQCRDFVHEVSVNLLCETDKDSPNTPDIDEQWEYWYKPVLSSYLTDDLICERNVSMIVDEIIHSLTYESAKTKKTGCFNRICAHGSNMSSLTYKGEISPCDKYAEDGEFISLKKKENIYDRDFLGMQNVRYVLNYYNEMFKEEKRLHCDSCPCDTVCMGECQAYNLSKYGKFCINENNVCEIYRRCYDFIEKNWVDMLLHNRVYTIGMPTKILSSALKVINERNLKICHGQGMIWLEENK